MDIIDLSSVIEANRAGIFIDNLIFPTGSLNDNSSHNCDVGSVKRFLNFKAPENGIVSFYIHRFAVPDRNIDIIIRPDSDLVHNDVYMRLTSTLFFAESHFAIALALDDDRAVVHNDLRKKSIVGVTFLKTDFWNIFLTIICSFSGIRFVQ